MRTKYVRGTSIQKRDNYIHIETTGCIVNIYPFDDITTIEVLPDQTDVIYTMREKTGYLHAVKLEK